MDDCGAPYVGKENCDCDGCNSEESYKKYYKNLRKGYEESVDKVENKDE
jgi:hypothetical protein